MKGKEGREGRELQWQMTSSSDQAEYRMTVLQVGAEALFSPLRMIYLYMCSHLLCIDLPGPDSRSRDKASTASVEPIQSYQI